MLMPEHELMIILKISNICFSHKTQNYTKKTRMLINMSAQGEGYSKSLTDTL